jgi:cruciform cutting endonuclease 1
MAFKIPSSLKLTQLRALAFKCGISTSGTKGILTQRLHDEISSVTRLPASKQTRVLSIDMGIRNLAYCLLTVPNEQLSLSPGISTKAKLPKIESWHRISVSSPVVETGEPLNPDKESFSPATLSLSAYKLLRHKLLPHNPTHILIERQRFRSMGSKHILEWTVRVNMFESIIYATLHTLEEEGVWDGEVVGVLPGKVGPFWVGENEKEKEDAPDRRSEFYRKVRNAKSSKIRSKGLKMDLVRDWLEAGDVVELGNQDVKERAKGYTQKWDRLPGRMKGVKNGVRVEGEMGKLDDLADCLLQGMAWIQWERNKRIALNEGVAALLEGVRHD